jgi:hypothetical protein
VVVVVWDVDEDEEAVGETLVVGVAFEEEDGTMTTSPVLSTGLLLVGDAVVVI